MVRQPNEDESSREDQATSLIGASPAEEFVELGPMTPGEILEEEFLKPMGITKYRLAKEIHVPATRIGEIVAGTRRITADTDLRLCRFFGLSDGFWLRLQLACDVETARRRMVDELDAIHPLESPNGASSSIESVVNVLR